jgi:hypothetical protein
MMMDQSFPLVFELSALVLRVGDSNSKKKKEIEGAGGTSSAQEGCKRGD